jgi:transposase, IS5 family
MRISGKIIHAGIKQRQLRRAQRMFWNYDLDTLVGSDHVLRKVKERLLVKEAAEERERWKKSLGREGYGAETGLRALFLQFWGNHSDREMEQRLRYDIAYRWFCDFTMESQTPDHTFFCRMRKAMGAENMLVMFNEIVKDAKLRQILKPFEAFVDASAIRRKEAEWSERDRQQEKQLHEIQDKQPEKNDETSADQTVKGCANSKENVKAYSADTEARWGCKGDDKYWFGYKRHVCVDTASGLIEKIAVTPANVNDSNAFGLVCPWGKRILADRGYDTGEVYGIIKEKGCMDRVMKLKNRKNFDAEKNKQWGRRRSPWEMVFAHMNKRTRYMGVKKTFLQAILEAIVFNMKRLVLLEGVNPPVIGLA